MRHLTPDENREIENVILYMSDHMRSTGTNKKPVIFHSIKVGFMAYQFGLSLNAIISGILHDVVEDTDLTNDDIERKYGPEIAHMVFGLTIPNEKVIKDISRKEYLSDWRNYFLTILDEPETLFLKLIDTHENFIYNNLLNDKPWEEALKNRTHILFDLAEEKYSNHETYKKIIEYYR